MTAYLIIGGVLLLLMLVSCIYAYVRGKRTGRAEAKPNVTQYDAKAADEVRKQVDAAKEELTKVTLQAEAKRMELYGFYNPPRDGKIVQRGLMNPVQWLPGGYSELNRRFTEYHEKKMSKEQFIDSMMKDIVLNAKDQCKHNLELKIKGWEFCQELKDAGKLN
jgi:hypothetical protein